MSDEYLVEELEAEFDKKYEDSPKQTAPHDTARS
jgi:hypothetical protein